MDTGQKNPRRTNATFSPSPLHTTGRHGWRTSIYPARSPRHRLGHHADEYSSSIGHKGAHSAYNRRAARHAAAHRGYRNIVRQGSLGEYFPDKPFECAQMVTPEVCANISAKTPLKISRASTLRDMR